jgi:hypothetical protein
MVVVSFKIATEAKGTGSPLAVTIFPVTVINWAFAWKAINSHVKQMTNRFMQNVVMVNAR